jgi:hypothetical protein
MFHFYTIILQNEETEKFIQKGFIYKGISKKDGEIYRYIREINNYRELFFS